MFGVYSSGPEYDRRKSETEKYYLKYAIRLKGVIADKRPIVTGILSSNYFTYIIKISECNVDKHDVRAYLEDYYVLIENDTVRFVHHLILGAEIGDSILVDYNNQKQYIWRGQMTPYKKDLPMFDLHYNSMRKESLRW